jgi:hypothetical protein
VRLRVIVWHPRAGWQREADVLDIGLGGTAVSLPEPLATGDHVSVSFVAPSRWDPLAMGARVAWVRPATRKTAAHAGLAFEPAEAEAMLAIFELVASAGFEE